ncbi:YigZ family protein [Helicobacter ailurogastricus]|uniref:FIG000605: protein co-occurring with transport systems (COG1739) n=1 Tax=Helicobacter ailurogastricus TaxID=1578720 RepID=A0A0K2XEP1_9HELI|nr:YigZ family protein [Helicobacter ailurogastricus]CRF41562.1 FIG000605: protein co-occurring with transport systems (COG1739) [Helicobacter ailurogastricus]CRF43251.1 FIG000605: protein co-occurring with transport systems (COG1739) [Helicobacter ailurogastricus]CRF44947.1 FIG000605: protein co-occurring with transport systems (COG1739) [Helicobacter ailurogastricus]CRF52442.1 FIG000605: protein co-occurring with transport systems (COG1739) [Helicobacter ailurogastricus]GLH57645.1 YigZ famil
MQTLLNTPTSKHQIKGSVFLGFLVPVCDFATTLKQLQKEHFKARHIVYAYRRLEDNTIKEALHEDREPRNSTKPLLDMLRREDLIDVAVFVVRYFGGVLLGVGGLMKAYGLALQLCLEQAKLEPFVVPMQVCEWVGLGALEALKARGLKYGVQVVVKECQSTGAWVDLIGAPHLLEKALGH